MLISKQILFCTKAASSQHYFVANAFVCFVSLFNQLRYFVALEWDSEVMTQERPGAS